MEDIIIKNGLIVTMDKQRRIIHDGAIVISDGKIVDVGKGSDVLRKYKADKVIDAKNHLVTPGFVNNHIHNSLYISRGLFDDGGVFPDFLTKEGAMSNISYALELAMSKKDMKAAGMASLVEQIKGGATSFQEIGGYHDNMDGLAEAMKEVGMRGIITRCVRDTNSPVSPVPEGHLETTKNTIAKVEKLYNDWHGKENDLIRVWYNMRWGENCSDELLYKEKELADKHNVGITAHANSRPERKTTIRLKRLGILDKNWCLSHMGFTLKSEIPYIKSSGAKIAHCPAVSGKAFLGNIHHGMILEFVKAGLPMSLGVDGVNEGNFADMVRIAYATLNGHWECFRDKSNLNSHMVMEWLTIGGAACNLWDDKLGSIERGKTADVALFSMKGIEWHPHVDPVAALLYAANGSSTSTVIINGKVVMEERKMLTVDEEQVAANADRAAERLRDSLGMGEKVKTDQFKW